MGARTSGREAALMVLFGLEDERGEPDEAVRKFFAHLASETGVSAEEDARAYALEVVNEVTSRAEAIDDLIRRASTNWRLERMSRVDRNVLRVAALELMNGVPQAVVIDEAVELAKRFGTEGSGAFVNGVLSKVADDLTGKGS